MTRPVIQEIKGLMNSFQEVRVQWAPRSANGVTHILAKEGVKINLAKCGLIYLQIVLYIHTVATEIPDVFE